MGYILLYLSTLRNGFILLSGGAFGGLAYSAPMMLNILIASAGFIFRPRDNEVTRVLMPVRKIIDVFIVLGLIWLLLRIVIHAPFVSSAHGFALFFLAPLSIFVFLRLNQRFLLISIYIVCSVIGLSCIIDFIVLNTSVFPPDVGQAIYFQYAQHYYVGGETAAYSKLGTAGGVAYRMNGLTGNTHDSSNILAIFAALCLGKILHGHRRLINNTTFRSVINEAAFLLMFCVIIFALMTTLSLANTLIFFVVAFCMAILDISNFFSKKILGLCFLVLIGAWLGNVLGVEYEKLIAWTSKLHEQELWNKMVDTGDSSFLSSLFVSLVGNNDIVQLSNITNTTEIGFVKMLTIFGIINIAPFCMLLLYPIYIFAKSPKDIKNAILPYVAAIGVAGLSLGHYSSLLRSTNIFLFYAIYALFISRFIDAETDMIRRKYMQLSQK